MAQITLYLDDTTAERLAEAAKREHLSKSAWVGRLIADRLGAEDGEQRLARFREARGSWPEGDDRPIEEIMRELRQPDWPERELDFG
jgi:hypothetical protein